MMEIWVPVAGFSNYEVSDQGRVRSLPHYRNSKWGRRRCPGKVLSPGQDKRRGHGHLHVLLTGNKQRKVHHLVLEAFVGPRPPGLLGLHRDGDPTNNHVENLYWGTQSENMRDAVRHGTHWNAAKRGAERVCV